ncbi:aminoglycoside phosphotransferase [Rhodobacter sp. TJ_12]|uniref:fructosamine kinase family protein n=1 Tax=Rhodobacter sp. TJ_12 TaxID=2029399 RepID=UPI001CBC8F0F|nr:fructosamine kinase family protein [Rhodobacter sp. TJ_12]MBZ4023884.1 aminoglycoside phosphotransferase [Rhodobacter sp. TJ_12]
MHPLAAHAITALDLGPCQVMALHGGDLSVVVRLVPESGAPVVAKSAPQAETEAAMLQALAAAGAPAPAVLAAQPGLLVLQDLGADTGLGAAWAHLGTVLAQLHAATGPHYGWSCDYAFGAVEIRNAPLDDWPSFWGMRRLLPFLPDLPAELACRVEGLARRLPELLPATPPAALLHGDLWVGNIMANGPQVTGLIDPASYYGDAEVDLAMLSLFGRPAPAFWAAYGALPPGAEIRRAIYQLFPALVHFRLFGAGYRGLVTRCLDAVGA